MEGPFEQLKQIGPEEIKKVFNNAKRTTGLYIAVNKKAQQNVQNML